MEKSCGVLLFRIESDRRLYLVLHYEEGHWDFPKGHLEKGESEHEAAVRETIEETGISDLDFVFGFRERLEYYYMRDGNKMQKEVFFFLARTENDAVSLSSEHTGFEWLPYEAALERLTFDNAKKILMNAEKALSAP
jgi:8-oxo-dGTP pyrophosphatase MutT (NUDIX family)